MHTLYNALVYLAGLLLPVVGLFSKKIKRNLDIRKSVELQLPPGKIWYWFHAASVGEYEQARALAVAIKKKVKNAGIVMSVYSESAYTQRKDDVIHDIFFALPLDKPNDMRRLVERIRPRAVFFSKYDVWPNLVFALAEKKIPTFLISATLPDKSARQKGFQKNFLRTVYEKLSGIYAIHEVHRQRFADWGLKAVVTGDTRFDAIAAKLQSPPPQIPYIEKLLSPFIKKYNYKIIVAGSTYPASQKMLLDFIAHHPDYFLVLAPHHVRAENIDFLKSQLSERKLSAGFFSEQKKTLLPATRVFVIDTMGLLPHLYQFGGFAYIGGAFEGSVHSVIEPVISGALPITGPHIRNSQEALDMRDSQLLHSLPLPEAKLFAEYVTAITPVIYKQKSAQLRAFFKGRCGATQNLLRILPSIWR